MIAAVVLALVAIVIGYVRLAPIDPAVWHVPPGVTADADLANGALRRRETGPEGLARLAALALATPRTRIAFGSVDSGMVTFVTRSRLIGFPDYATARQNGDWLEICARSRFGGSDWGVNKARIDAWLQAM